MECENNNHPLITFISVIKQQHHIFLNKVLEEETEGVSAGQTPYLMYLLYNEKICQDDLAKFYKQDKGVVARGIRKLEENGLITKEIDKTNRRKYVLSLNDKGRKLAERIIEINDEWETGICSDLNIPKERVCELLELIAQKTIEINKILTKMEDSNGRSQRTERS